MLTTTALSAARVTRSLTVGEAKVIPTRAVAIIAIWNCILMVEGEIAEEDWFRGEDVKMRRLLLTRRKARKNEAALYS
jgi:hypothetical protein